MIAAHRATKANRRLAAAFAAAGADSAVLPPWALARFGGGDIVLSRLDVAPSLDGVESRLAEFAAAAERGLHVLNRARAVIAAHDKLVTACCLREAGVPHPWTTHVFGVTPPVVPLPVILKPRFGSWGRDVHCCLTRAESEERFCGLGSRAWALRQGILVQEMIATTGQSCGSSPPPAAFVGAAKRVAPRASGGRTSRLARRGCPRA